MSEAVEAHGNHTATTVEPLQWFSIGRLQYTPYIDVDVSYSRKTFVYQQYVCGGVSDAQALHSFNALHQDLIFQNIRFKMTNEFQQILLCQSIKAHEFSIGGVALVDKRLLLLDIRSSDQQLQHLFWHELWHLLEGSISHDFIDKWDENFQGYLNIYQESSNQSIQLGSGHKGFINRYGQSFAKEERAEILAWLLRDPYRLTIYLKETRDSILAHKIYQMKKTLELLESR